MKKLAIVLAVMLLACLIPAAPAVFASDARMEEYELSFVEENPWWVDVNTSEITMDVWRRVKEIKVEYGEYVFQKMKLTANSVNLRDEPAGKRNNYKLNKGEIMFSLGRELGSDGEYYRKVTSKDTWIGFIPEKYLEAVPLSAESTELEKNIQGLGNFVIFAFGPSGETKYDIPYLDPSVVIEPGKSVTLTFPELKAETDTVLLALSPWEGGVSEIKSVKLLCPAE
ncbi:hypothetical protein FACS1894184_00040 [Clostridia bacterium]|nr:hypothetical protein FACS1894184_00040 [Clostridia bacterium]